MNGAIIIVGGLAAAYVAYRYSRGESLIPSSYDDFAQDFGGASASATAKPAASSTPAKTLGDYATGAITFVASDTAKIIQATGNAVVTVGGAAYSSAANIASGISKVGYTVGKTLGDVYSAAVSAVAPIAKTVSADFTSALTTVQSALSKTVTAVGGAVSSAVSSIGSSVGKTLGDVYSWLTGK